MRPRIHIPLTLNDQIVVSTWSRRIGGAVTMILVILVAWQMFGRHFDTGIAANASERPNDPTCITWDTRASEAIVSFVQGSRQDLNLGQFSDMITQMRRARRNCQLGWSHVACENYRAIVDGVARVAETISDTTVGCGLTTAGAPNATADRAAGH